VLLVGGSTKMPMVREMLAKITGKPPNAELDANQVVAHGAAIHAGILAAKAGEGALEEPSEFENVEVLNVNSHSLGVGVNRRGKEETVNKILIQRNTQIPCARSGVYPLKRAGAMSLIVPVFEGESTDPRNCVRIGECRMTGLPGGLPKGAPFQVRLAYEPNGLVTVMALDMTDGKFVQSVIHRKNGLTEADIARETEFVTRLEIGCGCSLTDSGKTLAPCAGKAAASMPFILQCPYPHCKKYMILEDDQRGCRVQCLVCEGWIDQERSGSSSAAPPPVPAPRPASTAAARAAAGSGVPVAERQRIIQCPKCKTHLRVPPGEQRAIRCAICQQVFRG
jgi:LSD1 subclass zinc finger protein